MEQAVKDQIKKVIVEKLKKQGLDVAEDAVTKMVKAVFEALPEILVLTPNKFDDLTIPVLGIIEAQIVKLCDKIDGQEG